MRPMPLRTNVGAICERMPPAPTQVMEAFEKIPWLKPGIFRWRSSAPATGLPLSRIEVREAVNAGCMLFYSVSVYFDLEVVIKPDEPYVTVAAEDGHDGDMPGSLQALLEVLVNAGRPG